MEIIPGFSKFDRKQRIGYISGLSMPGDPAGLHLHDYDAPKSGDQSVFEDMIENYIGNFPLPMGVVTNFVLNGELMTIPFVTEESSVVAAASKAAKFWASRGGFRASVTSTTKKGQVHFTWDGDRATITGIFPAISGKLISSCNDLTAKMRQRGGGITDMRLLDKTGELPGYFQLDVSFETAEAMGANFINSCLERCAEVLQHLPELNSSGNHVVIIMSILSNYTPGSKVRCFVECPVADLGHWDKTIPGDEFARRFRMAVDIANADISRAVTHNKGIFNGIDAVLVATGNDWRAVAACAHAYASREGRYKGLTSISPDDRLFRYELELPLAVGTVGGITQIHPVVKKAMAIMNNPDAGKLMMIAAASGLANNFSAISSLVTTGIQKGHMKMHLANVLNQLNATDLERERALLHFEGTTAGYSSVENYIRQIRIE